MLWLLLACPHRSPGPAPTPPEALLWFRPADTACVWERALGGSLVTLDRPCPVAIDVAHSATELALRLADDGTLVRVPRGLDGLPTGPAVFLPAPPVGVVAEVGYDAGGVLFALTEGGGVTLPDAIEFEGQRWSIVDVHEGIPELTHAFRWSGVGWERVETELSTTGWDLGLGVRALDASRDTQASRVDFHLGRTYRGDGVLLRPASDADAARLFAVVPAPGEVGEWQIARSPAGAVAWWNEQIEFLVPLEPLLVEVGGVWQVVAIDVGEFGPLTLQGRGDTLVVADYAGNHAQLVSLSTGRVTPVPEDVRRVLWWPPLPVAPG